MIVVALCAVLFGADMIGAVTGVVAIDGKTACGSLYPKRSLRSRRKTAERLPDYRASLLGLVPRG